MAHEQSANPFRPGNGVLPAYLAGRERPLAEFDAFVADQPSASRELDRHRPSRNGQDRPCRDRGRPRRSRRLADAPT